jgi:hypothetical protein
VTPITTSDGPTGAGPDTQGPDRCEVSAGRRRAALCVVCGSLRQHRSATARCPAGWPRERSCRFVSSRISYRCRRFVRRLWWSDDLGWSDNLRRNVAEFRTASTTPRRSAGRPPQTAYLRAHRPLHDPLTAALRALGAQRSAVSSAAARQSPTHCSSVGGCPPARPAPSSAPPPPATHSPYSVSPGDPLSSPFARRLSRASSRPAGEVSSDDLDAWLEAVVDTIAGARRPGGRSAGLAASW